MQEEINLSQIIGFGAKLHIQKWERKYKNFL